jgi:signal transduction histidine kinase
MPRILHIEDDAANRLLVRKLLRAAGHEVVDAGDGLEGVRLACAARPDLVLVDLNIPGLDGFEVTLRLRGEPSLEGVPIVAITAEGDRATSLAVGCTGFIQKPIDARSFAQTIGRYLEGKSEPSPSATSRDHLLRERTQRMALHLEEKLAELSTANDRLRELGAARSEFYRNISHELATPLTPVVGYLQMLLAEELGPLTKAQRKALSATEGCVHRLRVTLDNLLDVTGLETGRMRFAHRDYDFLDVVVGALEATRPRANERKIALLEDLSRGPMPAWGDPERLRRAILHLLENAVKFTPESGAIGVRVTRTSGGYEVCVADTGPGIAADAVERVFEPFVQLDGSVTREQGGVGIGLAIARRTSRGLGGDVRVMSPSPLVIDRTALFGSAFSLTVAERAPQEVRA